jgi:hypothetical protein
VAGAFAEADECEADPGFADDGHQPCPGAAGVLVEPVEKVLGPADVVAGVLVRLVEMQHVDDPERAGHGVAAVHGRAAQSVTQASGHAVPQSAQMCAVSVRPSPVSTSSRSM